MDYNEICPCPQQPLKIDFSVTLEESEDLEEIDDDELTEDEAVPHNIISQEISDKFDEQRQQIEKYKLSKATDCEVPANPAVQFMEQNIFPHLIHIMETTVNKAKKMECIKHQKSTFNGIDYIAEMFWNLNPRHPERRGNWTYIFDLQWVVDWLKNHFSPRPFFPFSWIWSKNYAATKIQAAMRGHWVRCRDDVQEMRQFWKTLAGEKRLSAQD